MRRLGIFCFYNSEGIISEDVRFLIEDLKTVLDSLVVVINGRVTGGYFENIADTVLKRENKGFDAAAYKYALQDMRVKELLEVSDEVVLCNDTFYGPFIPFQSIFNTMESKKADFWGLNYSVSGIEYFIQSFFLVFGSKIIKKGDLARFFTNYDDSIDDFMQPLIWFERELTHYLMDQGYSSSAYAIQHNHILRNVDGSVIIDGLPIIKKKAFSDSFYNKNKILNVLKWLKENSRYPIALILKDVYNRTGISISNEEISKHQINCKPENISRTYQYNIREIVEFINKSGCGVYIYGMGAVTEELLEHLPRYCHSLEEAIKGFIVSDDQIENRTSYVGIPIFRWSEVKAEMNDSSILIAMSKKNSRIIRNRLPADARVMVLNM